MPSLWRNRSVIALLGVVVALLVWVIDPLDAGPKVARMTAIAVWMAAWWVTEAVPIPVTSLLPLVLLPGLDIADLRATAASYGKPVIFLFLGGLLLAMGLERSGLHRRIALVVVGRVGGQPRRLLLGFMLATAFLSMWISNTAAVMVMLPIAMSVLAERGVGTPATGDPSTPQNLPEKAENSGDQQRKEVPDRGRPASDGFATALMLSIAYAGNIGGMATPVGTPPNLVLVEMIHKLLPGTAPPTFAAWMAMGVPLALMLLLIAWWLLGRVLFKLGTEGAFGGGEAVRRARAALGPVRRDELVTGVVFALVAVLWVSGSDLRLGDAITLPGWRSALGLEAVGDGAVAVAGAIALFVLPSGDRRGEALMDWETAERLPWGLLLLFGGGFALALGFGTSGLSAAIGGAAAGLAGLHPVLLIGIVCLVLSFLTELTSNTATTTLVLPILAKAAPALGLDPRALMIPATLSASCAFMMPVATPTNAIVFGSGHIRIGQMVRAGVWLNLIGVVVVTAWIALVGAGILGFSL